MFRCFCFLSLVVDNLVGECGLRFIRFNKGESLILFLLPSPLVFKICDCFGGEASHGGDIDPTFIVIVQDVECINPRRSFVLFKVSFILFLSGELLLCIRNLEVALAFLINSITLFLFSIQLSIMLFFFLLFFLLLLFLLILLLNFFLFDMVLVLFAFSSLANMFLC